MTECESLTASLQSLDKLGQYYQWISEEAHPFIGDRLAEIGAGIGTFTDVLVRNHIVRRPNTRLAVFEPERTLFQLLQERLERTYPELLRAGRVVATNEYFDALPGQFDTVIMNPPFGAQRAQRHVDSRFVEHALRLAPVAYSLHLEQTQPHFERLARSLEAQWETLARYDFPLPHQFAFHRKEKLLVRVVLLRFQRMGRH